MNRRPLCQQVYFDHRRRWEPVARENGEQQQQQQPSSSSSTRQPGERFEFTLMSYNILAQDLLEGHEMLYAHHNRNALSWAHRYARLMAEIHAIHPDILCVQELQQSHIEQFWSGLASFNYGMLYKKRTGTEKTDGCAVFYRRNLFDLVTHHEVEYFQPNVNKLNRENVAIIAKLALKSNPRAKLVVSTTHLLYNPRRQDVRLAQIQVLLAELDRLAYSGQVANGLPQYDPIILCGDFNTQPCSAPYRLLTKRYLRYDHLLERTLEPAVGSGYGERTGKSFLPPSLGITDCCQHDALSDREQTDAEDATVPPVLPTKLYHSAYGDITSTTTTETVNVTNGSPESLNPAQDKEAEKQSPTRVFSTGSLTHRFFFKSAYHNETSQRNEPKRRQPPQQPLTTATTFQKEWIMVDYMFYTPFRSVMMEPKWTRPNWNLELLGTYTLPTVQQCWQEIGFIPNMFYGSDHFSLVGRFLLTTEKANQ